MFYFHTAARNIERQKNKSILSAFIGIIIVLLLNIYIGNIDSVQKQLEKLPDAIPVSARICNLNGTLDAGMAIKREIIEGIQASSYVKEPVFTVQLMMGVGEFTIEDYKGKLNLFVSCTNDIKGIGGLKEEEISWMDGEEADFFTSDRKECIMDKNIMDTNGLKVGDTVTLTAFYYRYTVNSHEIFIDPLKCDDYKIAGAMEMTEYTGKVVPPSIILPLKTVMNAFDEENLTFTADSASFGIKNPFQLNELKEEMKSLGLLPVASAADYQYDGNALTVRDSTFVQAAEQLEESRTLLRTAFPCIMAIVVFIGYITAYLMIQSRRGEYAVMRSLGMKHGQCFAVMFLENAFIEGLGCAFGSLTSFLMIKPGIQVLASVILLFLSCYLSGTAIALWNLGRFSVMEVLTKDD